jgi:lysophospholipase L1-like esterase
MNWTAAVRVARSLVPGTALLAVVSCGGPNSPTPVEAPSVACPANMTVSGVIGGMQAVSFALPTVTGGTQPVGITCTPGSGTTFSVGSTTVACTASDASSRTAQCTFTVTLNPALSLAITKFMAFGDSVTEGQNGRLTSRGERVVDVPNSYPTQLESMLNTEYVAQPITVVNRGYGGKLIDDLRKTFTDDLKSVRPQAVLLLGGYNDLLASCKPRDAATPQCTTATNDVASGVRKMIVSSKEAAIKYIFVSTLTPSGPYLGVGNDRRIAEVDQCRPLGGRYTRGSISGIPRPRSRIRGSGRIASQASGKPSTCEHVLRGDQDHRAVDARVESLNGEPRPANREPRTANRDRGRHHGETGR